MTYRKKSSLWAGFILILFLLSAWSYGEFDVTDALVLFGLCFACELVDSGLGMGYGTILTPTLLMLGYHPQEFVPTILFSELLSGFTASFFHNEIKNVELSLRGKDFRPAVILATGSVVGVSAGVFLSFNIPKDVLKVTIGCIILTSGLFVILVSRRVIEYKRWKMLVLSIAASFNKAVSGGGYGPLVTSGQILSGVQGK
ncbi:MAG: sulfite exporter TauE/SafE family protein, partial [Desulfuromonadales bacterium]|nr:sulfite exporter TauE/SafE family protein [Desulfuromonadales bacterium]